MANKRILLGLTTITAGGWKNKIKEIDELGLKEIAIFPTSLNSTERQELYRRLERTKLTRIPHAHLRDDMRVEEIKYLVGRFKTAVFNVHSGRSRYAPKFDYQNYYKQIYIENTPEELPTELELKKYAGLCLDLNHWESVRLKSGAGSRENRALISLAKRYPIGINHVGAINKKMTVYYDLLSGEKFFGYDSHYLKDLSQLNYVKKYKKYLADIISLELENPLKRQLEVKKYLEKIIF